MDFIKPKPIYLQIAEHLMEQIQAGNYSEGDRLPSVREVASLMGVNPNTVMRSFEYLQNANIIFPQRGMGYYVAEKASERICALWREEFLEQELPAIKQRMKMLNIPVEALMQ